MPNTLFNRIAQILTGRAHRRETLGALIGGGFAAVATRLGAGPAAAKKKKRCRKRLETCGGKKKCCNGSGLSACREYPTESCMALTGKRCCGLDGASCSRDNPSGTHCECCDGHFCNMEGRCQAEFK